MHGLLRLISVEVFVLELIFLWNIWDMILITFEHIQKGEKEWIR